MSTKIFIITVCLLITVGGAIYGMVALGMSRSYFLELDRSLSNQTEKMVLQLSNTSVQEIDGILKMFALEHGISIVLKDSDEKVLGIYGDMEYSLAPGTDVEDILLGSGITESYSCKLTNGKTYWIQVFGNKEKVNIGLESLKRILPMLGAITFLAALAIAALYTKYITRSILKVSEVSKKMANLDFRVRYTEDRRDEIGILGENLNELSEKLESALDELKEKNTDLEKSIKLEQQLEQQQMAFFSAVSHELKTPITILKGQIQGMLLEVGGYKDRDRYLKRSFEVANSMENMVQEILYVSKIRTSGFELKLIDIPLHQLVENVIKEQEDMAIDRGLQFHIRIEESTWIRADEALFTKVISNVVGNAIKYTNEDGNIWVGVYKRGEEIIFWIENETENIQKLVDAGEWTEAEATEALEYYDEILKSILEGKMVGKRASSSDDHLFFYMPDNAQPEQYQTFVFDGNTYKSIGPFDTEEELFNALKEYTDTEVEAGTMSQAEATALLEKYQ